MSPPTTLQLGQLQAIITSLKARRPVPGSGMRLRLNILLFVASWSLVWAVIYLSLVLLYSWKKRAPNDKIWLIKSIPLTNKGLLLVTNTKLISALLALIALPLVLLETRDTFNVFFNNGSQTGSAALRAFTTFPIALTTWMIGFGAMQSVLATQEKSTDIKPRVVNGLFVGGTIGIVLGLVGASTAVGILGARASQDVEEFEKIVLPLLNPLALVNSSTDSELGSIVSGLEASLSQLHQARVAEVTIALIVTILVELPNLAGFYLTRVVLQQVKVHKDMDLTSTPLQSLTHRRLPSSDSLGSGQERRRRLVALQTLAVDLFVTSVSLLLGTTIWLGALIWISTSVDVNFSQELGITTLEDLYSLGVGIAFPVHVYNVARNLCYLNQDPEPSSVTMTQTLMISSA